MKKCDEGYFCYSCKQYVENISESDLYLRALLGEIRIEELPSLPERHIRCHPELAQFIMHQTFLPIPCSGPFSKHNLDSGYVSEMEKKVTTAWVKLQNLAQQGENGVEAVISEMNSAFIQVSQTTKDSIG